jgi:hypothetical protein
MERVSTIRILQALWLTSQWRISSEWRGERIYAVLVPRVNLHCPCCLCAGAAKGGSESIDALNMWAVVADQDMPAIFPNLNFLFFYPP